LEQEFGWPRTLMSSAVSLNLVLYGLMAPFAAALMDRFGIRWVTSNGGRHGHLLANLRTTYQQSPSLSIAPALPGLAGHYRR
jgi:MFS family permease